MLQWTTKSGHNNNKLEDTTFGEILPHFSHRRRKSLAVCYFMALRKAMAFSGDWSNKSRMPSTTSGIR
jgi:hypothetical protein